MQLTLHQFTWGTHVRHAQSNLESYMKLATYVHKGVSRAGVVEAGEIFPLLQDMLSTIVGGQTQVAEGASVLLSDIALQPPLLNPPRIFGIGLNYVEHAAESQMKVQDVPTVFMKLTSSITGPEMPIFLPPQATQPDYEAELAVVIGKGGRNIAATAWEEHVFGYTILNDVSARGVQLATTQWTLGKSFPSFTPLGPWIVTADEVGDPHALDIECVVAGETLQSANTRDLIFRIPALIEYISSITPLEPGDIISTGTPPGVGLGRTPQRWLKPDEDVVITIEKIGSLRNRTVAVER